MRREYKVAVIYGVDGPIGGAMTRGVAREETGVFLVGPTKDTLGEVARRSAAMETRLTAFASPQAVFVGPGTGEGRSRERASEHPMSKGPIFEFGFDEQHHNQRDLSQRTCPVCDSPLQASQYETVCLDCGRVIESERGDR